MRAALSALLLLAPALAPADEPPRPVQLDAAAGFSITASRATIAREGEAALAAGLPATPEATASRQLSSLDLSLALTLSRTLVLFGELPVILSDTRRLDARSGATVTLVDEGILNAPLPASVTRSGLGDARLGFRGFASRQAKQPARPDWSWAAALRLPTGEQAAAGNTGAGQGLVGVELETAFEKRVGKLAALASFSYRARLAKADDPLFRDVGAGQRSAQPGQEGEAAAGLRYFAWEASQERRAVLSARAALRFTSLGRGYTPLFDFLAETEPGQSALVGVDEGGEASEAVPFDGLLEEEQFTTLGASVGADLRPTKALRLRASLGYERSSDHLLSFGASGLDQNGNGQVDSDDERNPFFQPLIDQPGLRIRAEDIGAFVFALSAGASF